MSADVLSIARVIFYFKGYHYRRMEGVFEVVTACTPSGTHSLSTAVRSTYTLLKPYNVPPVRVPSTLTNGSSLASKYPYFSRFRVPTIENLESFRYTAFRILVTTVEIKPEGPGHHRRRSRAPQKDVDPTTPYSTQTNEPTDDLAPRYSYPLWTPENRSIAHLTNAR